MSINENNNEMIPATRSIKELLRSWSFWKPVAGIMAGGLAGFLYFYFIGCNSGTCPITSNPYISIVFGAAMGYLITSGPCTRC